MDQLVNLIVTEKAKELRFAAGHPPLMVSDNEQHPLQGPPVSGEELALLLRSLADSRQMRELRERGATQFVHTAPDRMPVLVRARMNKENIVFDIS